MAKYQVIINEGVDENTKEIINKYWHYDGNKFTYLMSNIIAHYSLRQNSLLKLISTNSYCLKERKCIECRQKFNIKIDILREIFNSSGFSHFTFNI